MRRISWLAESLLASREGLGWLVIFEQDPNRIVNWLWPGPVLGYHNAWGGVPPPPPSRPFGFVTNVLPISILILLHLHLRLRTSMYALQTYCCNGPKHFLNQSGNISRILLMQQQFVVTHRYAVLQEAERSWSILNRPTRCVFMKI